METFEKPSIYEFLMGLHKMKYNFDKAIRYPMSESYVNTWGIEYALREVFQNFIDYGDFKYNNDFKDYRFITNDYIMENLLILKLGVSVKENTTSIGKHGEGLKLALLIFARLNIPHYCISGRYVFKGSFETDDDLGNIFVIEYTILEESEKHEGFVFMIHDQLNKVSNYYKTILTDKDILKKTPHGSIVDKNKGDIYVGRIFVTNDPKLQGAYSLPTTVRLERDRSLINDYDLKYYISLIITHGSSQGSVSTNFLNSKDGEYIHSNYVNPKDYRIIPTAGITGVFDYIVQDKLTKEFLINKNIKDYIISKLRNKLNIVKNNRKKYQGYAPLVLIDILENYISAQPSRFANNLELVLNKLKDEVNRRDSLFRKLYGKKWFNEQFVYKVRKIKKSSISEEDIF